MRKTFFQRGRRLFSVATGLSIALSFAVPQASADQHHPFLSGTLTFTLENDKIANTDRNYTNGTRIAWVSDKTTGGPDVVRETLDFLYPLADVSGGRIGLALGQSIFTPADTDARALITTDRPYAGWLYGAFSIYAESDWSTNTGFEYTTLDSVELSLGVVGPAALGEQVQNNFHKLINVDESFGWDNQLENEPAIALFFERKWRPAPVSISGFEADIIPHAGGSLGNVFTLANAGLTLRFGQNLDTDFGPPQIRPAFSGPGAVSPDTEFAWYVFAGVQGSAVARNIFLDGNTFRDSHSVDRKILVGDFQIGAAIVYKDVRLAATHVFRTREFDNQDEPDRFGVVSLSYHF